MKYLIVSVMAVYLSSCAGGSVSQYNPNRQDHEPVTVRHVEREPRALNMLGR